MSKFWYILFLHLKKALRIGGFHNSEGPLFCNYGRRKSDKIGPHSDWNFQIVFYFNLDLLGQVSSDGSHSIPRCLTRTNLIQNLSTFGDSSSHQLHDFALNHFIFFSNIFQKPEWNLDDQSGFRIFLRKSLWPWTCSFRRNKSKLYGIVLGGEDLTM